MATQKPKTTAKRKTSVRVTKKKRGISKLQAIVLVGVLAAIGVVAVALTRASGTPDYQYSWNKYCVAAYGSSSAPEVAECKDKSAESMVYRLYRGLDAKSPDVAGYKYWTQKLAGDRIKITETNLVTSNTTKLGLVAGNTASQSSDTAFVKALYKNMLRREAKESEMVGWRNKLKAEGNKKWSREKMVYAFAISGEAITKNRGDFDLYATPDKTVTVVQNAAIAQRGRYEKMFAVYAQPAKRDREAAESALNTAKAQLTAANKSASKNPPSAADLNSISSNQAKAGSAYATASSKAKAAAEKVAAAERLYNQSKELADYATDIADNQVYGISKIGDRYRSTKSFATGAASYAASTKARIGDIAKQYTVANNKYKAEQVRLAAVAAKAAKDKATASAAAAAAKKAQDEKNWAALVKYAKNAADCTKFNYTIGVESLFIAPTGQVLNQFQDALFKPKSGGGCTGSWSSKYTGSPRYPFGGA